MRLLLAVAAVVLAAPADALAAPAITLDRTCYTAGGDQQTITGTGFSPNGEVKLVLADAEGEGGDKVVAADANGAFTTVLNAPELHFFNAQSPSIDVTLTATDVATGTAAPPLAHVLTDFDVKVPALTSGKLTSIKRKVPLTAYGWTTQGTVLYAHYFRGKKRVYTQRIGGLTGPCGNLKKKVRFFNFKNRRPGRYLIRFSAKKKWNKDDRWVAVSVRLT